MFLIAHFVCVFEEYSVKKIMCRVALLVAYKLGTMEVVGSNPDKGESLFQT